MRYMRHFNQRMPLHWTGVRVCMKLVCNCMSRSVGLYFPNPGECRHRFPALPVWMGITLPSIKSSLSHTLPVIVLSLLTFVIIKWQKRCRLSASHWLFDIESCKRRGVPSRPYTSPHSFAWRPGGGVVGDGGCASVSAPALYPFLSITVQVKQMIGFSQQGD